MEQTEKIDYETANVDLIQLDPPEPRWPAIIAAISVGLLYFALPSSLSIGPRWLVPVVIGVLTLPPVISHRQGQHRMNFVLGIINSSVLTLFMIWSLVLLVNALLVNAENPKTMLRSALALWVSNVLIFALWYWRLDAGGPNRRDITAGHRKGAFLFPQMTEEGYESAGLKNGQTLWSPQFVDYLFLAFNTSTAFSPTDAPVLSRWAKVLTMIQSSISLAVVVLLAARAVNILQPPT
jgi:hypothetical protein